jgi:hypothetical protein
MAEEQPVRPEHLPDDFFVDMEMEPVETPEPLAVDLNDVENLNRQLQAAGGIFHIWRDGWGLVAIPFTSACARQRVRSKDRSLRQLLHLRRCTPVGAAEGCDLLILKKQNPHKAGFVCNDAKRSVSQRHVVPPLPSSSTTPMAVSWSRMRSDSAQSLPARAARRAAISASTSAASTRPSAPACRKSSASSCNTPSTLASSFKTCRQTGRCIEIALTQTVDLAHHLEQHRAGFRRAEVVVHHLGETLDEGFAASRRLRSAGLSTRGRNAPVRPWRP